MSKFGELIESTIPVLLEFYKEDDIPSQQMSSILRTVASDLGNHAKVIKIDIDKNKELSDALQIKETPTFLIYKEGEMKWRQSGELSVETLVGLVKEYV